VKEGFRGRFSARLRQKPCGNFLLQDSAEIQRDDTKIHQKKRAKMGLPPYQPLYTRDVAGQHFLCLYGEYGNWFEIEKALKLCIQMQGTSSAALRACTHNRKMER